MDPLSLLPSANYEGYTFTALTNSELVQHAFNVESEDGEIINDTIYRRNRKIEERYTILFKEKIATWDEVYNLTRSTITADSDEFDVIFNLGHVISPSTAEGLFCDWFKLENVDLSAAWWDQNAIRDLSVANKLFIMYGDYAIHHFALTQIMYFNKRYVEDNSLEDPYELVRTKRWTIDKFNEMGKKMNRDTSGDDVYDNDDQWGYTTDAHNFFALMAGAGVRLSENDRDGIPQLVISDEKFFAAFDKVMDIFYNDNGAYNQSNMKGRTYSYDDGYVDMFVDGKALFMGGTLYWVSDKLRAMKDDYGYVPMPLWDENQERFYSFVNFSASPSAIPITAKDPAKTGLILSALACESLETLIPAYYKTAIEEKFSRDGNAKEMLDIIRLSRMYDPTTLYQWGGLLMTLRELGLQNNRNIASKMKSQEKSATAALNKFVGLYDKLA